MADEQDIQDVIKTLIAEGIGEGEEGMRRIAETIITRGQQRGLTPAQVVRERAQYTGYSHPGPAAVRAQSDPNALSAAQAAWALAQGPDDPTNGANHYWNPNIVSPSWAGKMTSLGQYGNHAFATDRAVMRPKVSPSVASQSPMLAASRANTSPSGGNTALQQAVMRAATVKANRVEPQSRQQPDLQTALNAVAARKAAEIAVKANAPAIQAARRATLSIGANQSYAGQDRGETRTATRSAIGQPPATRIVQSVPVRKPVETAMQTARKERSEQVPNRLSALTAAGPTTPVVAAKAPTPPIQRALTQQQKLAIMNTAQPDDRLPSTPMAGARALPPIAQPGTEAVATLLDTVDPTSGKRSTAPVAPVAQAVAMPRPRPERPVQQPPAVMQAVFNAPAQQPVMRAPLRVVVQGSNTQQPIIRAPALTPQQAMIAAGNAAVSQSGDDSVGNRAEAAAVRASAQSYREAKARR